MKRIIVGLIFLAIGGMLLMRTLGYTTFDWFFNIEWSKFILPGAIIFGGLCILFGRSHRHDINDRWGKEGFKEKAVPETNSGEVLSLSTSFGGDSYNFAGQKFSGAHIDASMGGFKIDLRKAIIDNDCRIEIHTFMGGVELLMPENVNIQVNSHCFIGGVGNQAPRIQRDDQKTITIDASCMFGGTNIK